jgi:hypothetical protein
MGIIVTLIVVLPASLGNAHVFVSIVLVVPVKLSVWLEIVSAWPRSGVYVVPTGR